MLEPRFGDASADLTGVLQEATEEINRTSGPPSEVVAYAPKPGVHNLTHAGALISNTLTQACESTAQVIEQDAQELFNQVQSYVEQSKLTAQNLRDIGQIEAQRNVAFTQKLQDARKALDEVAELFRASHGSSSPH
jgi:hypothetical protein